MQALIKEKNYGNDKAFRVMVLSPHGSSGVEFFKQFPEILNHPKIRDNKDVFLRYIELEKDSGATELCHKIAEFLASKGVSSLVVELDYPRAILDGGRVLEKCIRSALPGDLDQQLQQRFLTLHQKSLSRLLELYEELNKNNGLIIDVHTMASFCPMYKGAKHTKAVSFETLDTYIRQYHNAPRQEENLRYFDLITSDVRGAELGDHNLKQNVEKALIQAQVPYRLNKPYAASDEFLMYPNLTHCRGLCFDIPKHSLTTKHDKVEEFDLAKFEIDNAQIELYASIMGDALINTLD